MDELKNFVTRKSVRQKINGYLFNPNNYEGWMKGQWFIRALGFDPKELEQFKMLEEQIKFNPNEAVYSRDTKWGVRYKQKLTIIGPNGKMVKDIRSHWQIDTESGVVTLVTLLPPKKNR